MQELETRRGKYSASAASIGANSFGNKQDMDLESGKSLESAQILNQTSTYHLSRADAARNLQGMIAEIGQMFNKMSHMIVQQEEMVQRIDQDVGDSLDHVNEGHSELLKYFNSISGNRSLILKLFAILLAFIIIFAIFS
jgi:syntaxin 5